ncbi:MAG: EI24 domain-containing protein [Alphaproteobacteria bacterium]
MIGALFKAFSQFGERRSRRILIWVFLISLGIAGGLIAVVSVVLTNLDLLDIGWLDSFIDALGVLAAVFVAWLLFPVIAVMIAYMYTDPIAEAVEARYYPDLPPAKPETVWHYAKAGIRFEIVALALNILILPLAIIPFVNVIYPFIFFAMNGYLFGRELFEIVAPRRMSFAQTRTLRRRHRIKLLLAGALIAGMFMVPIFNLIAPVVATAFMVHVFHGLAPRGDGWGEPAEPAGERPSIAGARAIAEKR